MGTHLSATAEIAALGDELAEIRIADVCAELRRKAKQISAPFSTHKILEGNYQFRDVVVTGRRLPPGIQGTCAKRPQGRVIVYARGLPDEWRRYAIMHELGHLIFDGEDAFRRPDEHACPRREARADFVAEEILVPLYELLGYVSYWPSKADLDYYEDSVDEIASHFKVPAEIVDRRIRLLEWMRVRAGSGRRG